MRELPDGGPGFVNGLRVDCKTNSIHYFVFLIKIISLVLKKANAVAVNADLR